MATYLTVYRYKKNNHWKETDNYACFSCLFRDLNDSCADISEIDVYMFRRLSQDLWQHNLEFSNEEMEYIIKSFGKVFEEFEIFDMKAREIPNFDRYSFSKKFLDSTEDAVCIKLYVKGMTIGRIKLLVTIVRYFYETHPRWVEYVKVMQRYLEYSKKEEFNSIPRIELLQICHSNTNCAPVHAIIGTEEGELIIPIKENIILERIKDESIIYVNINGIFANVGRKSIQKFDFNQYLKDYINENYNTGPKEVC